MKLYTLPKDSATAAPSKNLVMQLYAEGPRSELGPMMQKLREIQGTKGAIYDDAGNYVSGTI